MIIIDKTKVTEAGLTIPEALLLLFYHYQYHEGQVKNNLFEKGLVNKSTAKTIKETGILNTLTPEGDKVLDYILSTQIGNSQKITKERLTNLATQLKSIFPRGKKDGTNSYWAEGTMLIVKRLEQFFKKYGSNFSDEDIITATRRYVHSFNGNYTYMRTLKYFLFRSRTQDGETIETSELLTYLENKDSDNIDNDWTSELV